MIPYLRSRFQSIELRIHWRNDMVRDVRKMLQCIFHKESRQAVNKEDEIPPWRVLGSYDGENSLV